MVGWGECAFRKSRAQTYLEQESGDNDNHDGEHGSQRRMKDGREYFSIGDRLEHFSNDRRHAQCGPKCEHHRRQVCGRIAALFTHHVGGERRALDGDLDEKKHDAVRAERGHVIGRVTDDLDTAPVVILGVA